METIPKKPFWSRNFTLMVVGQAASLFANNILHFAVSLYLLKITGSVAVYALVTGLSTLPMILLTPVGGVLADRVNRRNLMVVFDGICAASCLLLALCLRGQGPLVPIALFLTLLGILEAFYPPCVQACIPTLQQGPNLVRANALVTQLAMGANIFGPVLGGVLFGLFGVGPLILVSMVCFALSAVMECFIRLPFTKRADHGGALQNTLADIRQGAGFLRGQRGIGKIVLAAGGLNFLMASLLSVGFPYFITVLWGYTERAYGFATGGLALAGIAGAALAAALAGKLRIRRSYRLLALCGLGFLPLGAGFALGAGAGVLLGLLMLCGMCVQLLGTLYSVLMTSGLQAATPEALLGKVMAATTTVCICAEPLGRIVYGAVFEAWPGGTGLMILLTGALVVALALFTKKAYLHELPEAMAK